MNLSAFFKGRPKRTPKVRLLAQPEPTARFEYLVGVPTITEELHNDPNADEKLKSAEVYAAAALIRERRARDPQGYPLRMLIELPTASIPGSERRTKQVSA